MAEKMREGKVRCSFCQKTEDQVRKLIAGPDGKVFICDECIGICSEIMEEELNPYDDEVLNSDINLLKPEEIHAVLDEDVYKRQSVCIASPMAWIGACALLIPVYYKMMKGNCAALLRME